MNHRRPCASGILLAATLLCAFPALADKPDWAGGPHAGKHGKHEREHEREHEHEAKREVAVSVTMGGYFAESHRVAARAYYEDEHRHSGGKACPPGLAKKHNGCLPPGQARKWAVGQPLPREVVYYPVPPAVVVKLGPPPAGYNYVRVAADILLIAAGTRMVMDGMQDLVR